jgi:hypothetical protein
MSDFLENKSVQVYADSICLFSKAGLKCIQELNTNLSKTEQESSRCDLAPLQSLEILLEFIYLYLHLTSRMASGIVEFDETEKLINVLSSKCINAAIEFGLFGLQQEAKDKIRQKAFKNFIKVDAEYSKYFKLLPEGNVGAEDTLFSQFSKNIASIAGIERGRWAYNNACLKIITHALQKMNPNQFIKNLRGKKDQESSSVTD